MSDANALKDQGNKAFAAKDYDTAITLFTQAIALDPKNHVLYSNRSAAKAGKKQWDEALADAEECVKLNPTWGKGHARKGAALHGAKKFDLAIEAYEEGIKVEDSPALQKGLQEVRDAKRADADLGIGRLFTDPNLMAKLAANPKTAKHLADQSFMQKLQMIQRMPQLAQSLFNSDPRMIEVLGVLMGININAFSRPEGSDELPPGLRSEDIVEDFSPPPSASASSPPPRASSSTSKPPPFEEAKVEEVEEMDVDDDEAVAKKSAEGEKKLGNEAYKKRDFEPAVAHFEKAWDLWPKDITFLTNLAAVYFEQGDYDKCIETCDKAVEEGRSIRADYKLVAKAFGRTGSAYAKKGDFTNAIKFFEKSLSEHRTPDILNKLREVEKAKSEDEKSAYIDPAKSEIAREEGNTLYKAGDFAGAVKAYTESIKRDPNDPRGYNNRALCYTKLVAFPEALKDTETAIKVDPKFVKAYIRKSTVLFSMREFTKALEAVQQAEDADTEKKHTQEIQSQQFKCQQILFESRGTETEEQTLERAMRDPEVAKIMQDPIMQSILQQAQQNPAALADHMKNPTVRSNIQKLINAGIIKTR